jgi:p-aminobenzoyl-glutamate transporter AbgT
MESVTGRERQELAFNKRLLKNLDYVLIGNIILIMGLSLLILSSATANIAAPVLTPINWCPRFLQRLYRNTSIQERARNQLCRTG